MTTGDSPFQTILAPRLATEPTSQLVFSQGSLQDYADCPRRFQLRYWLSQPWPALETQPQLDFEHYQELGQQFHRILQRYFAGMPVDRISAGIEDAVLRQWWQAFLASPPLGLPQDVVLAEQVLATTLAGQRLVARYDLLALANEGPAVIVDWKTGRRPLSRDRLAARLQSWVYPFVLVEAGGDLGVGPIAPERVRMVYWFANDPQQPVTLTYSTRQHEAHRRYLAALLQEIAGRSDPVWPLTSNTRECRFCTYRSLCDRGVEAGDWANFDEDREPDLDFGLADVPEIAF
jgi:hypothetical protein